MTPRSIRPVAVAAGLFAVAAAAAPGAAQAAEPKFTCEASALRGTILGQALEPAVYGRGQECKTGQNIPTVALPGIISAKALVASGTKVDDALKPAALAAGGIASLQLQLLPTLQGLPALPNADAAIDGLPVVPLSRIPGIPATPLTPAITLSDIDIRPLARAALAGGKLPNVDLLSTDVLSSTAAASCSDGKLTLNGASTVAGLKVLGLPVNLDKTVQQNLNVLDSRSFDPSKITVADLRSINPALDTALGGAGATLIPAVQALLTATVGALPPISIPAAVAEVKVTAGGQTKTGDSLTQQAARVQVSLVGQALLDVVVGEAKVSAVGPCPVAAVVKPVDPPPAELGCTDRKLVLVDVFQQGSKGIKLKGAADKAFAGKTVSIRFGKSKKVVATAKVGENGGFSTFAKTPPKSIRNTNDARYTAVRGNEKSLSLKLTRRMRVSRVLDDGKQVTITGFVRMPLAAPAATINLRQRIQCGKQKVIATTKPNKDGRYTFKVKSPDLPAVYRATTRVRNNKSNPKTYPTFTLPRGVDLLKR